MRYRGSNPHVEEAPAATLAKRLERITEQTAKLVSAESLEPPQRAIEGLRAAGLAARALKQGQRAPEFELPDHGERLVRSADLLARGPLLVSFFRGRWDPYCMTELAAWKEAWPQVEAAGAGMVAISPQTIKHTGLVYSQFVPRFPVLRDAGNEVARRFGLVYRVPEELREHLLRILINLKGYNGDESWELPLPATYVVAQDGTIVYAFADEDPRRRAEPAEVISVLRALTGAAGTA